jgi:hypothetical protein
MGRTVRSGTHEKVFFAIHGEEAPDEREWEDMMVPLIRLAEKGAIRCVLIFTDGGAPNGAQRKRITDNQAVAPLPTSCVTDSAVVRGVLTALRWMGKVGKPFSPAHIHEALDHLQIPPGQRPELLRTIALNRISLATGGSVEALDQKLSRTDLKWLQIALRERISRLTEKFPTVQI